MQRLRREGNDSAARTRLEPSTHTVDVIVLSADSALLATLREVAGVEHAFFPVESAESAVDLLVTGHCGIFIIDLAVIRGDACGLIEKLHAQFPEVVLLATGRRDEQNAVAGLVGDGSIYRFLHKPVSPARAEMFLSAGTRRHGEVHHHETRSSTAVNQRTAPRSAAVWIVAVGIVFAVGATWLFMQRSDRTATRSESTANAPVPNTEIAGMLTRAEAALAAGRLIPPVNGNALELFRAALQLDPGNKKATDGVARIIETLERRVSNAMAANDAPQAAIALTVLQRTAPDHPQLDALQAHLVALSRKTPAIAQPVTPTPQPQVAPAPIAAAPRATAATVPATTQPRSANVELARAYLAANQLIDPIDASALSQLRRAREAGEDEDAIKIAATDLGTRLLNRALVAVSAVELETAKTSYEAASTLDREFETALPDIDIVATQIRELETAVQRTNAVREQVEHVTRLRTSGQLIEPPGENAYEAFMKLSAEYGTEAEVKNEQQRLASTLLDSIRTAIAARDIDGADVLATRVEEIQPGLPQTKVLREQIGAARQARAEETALLQAASLPRRREVPAVYPRPALESNIEGWVDLEFTITAEGAPIDVIVKNAMPSRTFDAAALQALRQWRFEPIMREGAAQTRRAALRIEFKLK